MAVKEIVKNFGSCNRFDVKVFHFKWSIDHFYSARANMKNNESKACSENWSRLHRISRLGCFKLFSLFGIE